MYILVSFRKVKYDIGNSNNCMKGYELDEGDEDD